MGDQNEPNRSVLDRIRAAIGRAKRAITGGDAGEGEYADPRMGQMMQHEQEKMNDFVELAEEHGEDDEPSDRDAGDDAEGRERR